MTMDSWMSGMWRLRRGPATPVVTAAATVGLRNGAHYRRKRPFVAGHFSPAQGFVQRLVPSPPQSYDHWSIGTAAADEDGERWPRGGRHAQTPRTARHPHQRRR